MRYGVIDIGTNSMRLLIAQVDDGKIVSRKKYVNTTRLGQGIDKNRRISREAIERNIKSLMEFKKVCIGEKCDIIKCVGTAALRKAVNSDEFVGEAKDSTGIDVEIISGEKEAFLGYSGVVGGIDLKGCLSLVIDIGGGSTEFVLGNDRDILFRESVEVGALVLTDMFVSGFPEKEKEIEILEDYIDRNISETIIKIKEKISSYDSAHMIIGLIGIGGTITSVSAINQKLEVYSMEKVHKSKVYYKDVCRQIENIRKMSLEERREIKGLQKKRAEIILTGELILKSIMKKMKSESITVSEFDNLEGIVITDQKNI